MDLARSDPPIELFQQELSQEKASGGRMSPRDVVNKSAFVDPVAPYVYASNVDDDRVVDLIERIAVGAVDVIAFTSASQVRRLWDVARKRRMEAPLRTGLAHAVVAAVGPVTAKEAARFGMETAIMSGRVHDRDRNASFCISSQNLNL